MTYLFAELNEEQAQQQIAMGEQQLHQERAGGTALGGQFDRLMRTRYPQQKQASHEEDDYDDAA